MLQFQKITLEGFKSFLNRQVFTFPQQSSGFYFVEGRNEIEPELGANDCGKSTFLSDALYWAFYDVTPRGVKASNIRTWGNEAKETSVQVDFILDGEQQSLYRSWGPNVVKINGKIVSQEEVEKLIRLSPDAFCNSILIPQSVPMFFDWQKSEKLQLFSAVMDLDCWLEHSETAGRMVETLEKDLKAFQNQKSNQEGELNGLIQSLEKLAELSDQWEVKNKQDIVQRQKQLADAVFKLNQHEAKIAGAYEELSRKRVEMTGLRERIKVLKAQREKEIKLYQDIAAFTATTNSDIANTQLELGKFQVVSENPVCPYCNQKVSKKHIEGEIEKLTQKLDKLISARDCYQVEIEEYKNKSVLSELEIVNQQLETENQSINELSTIYGRLETESGVYVGEKNKLIAGITELENAKNDAKAQFESGLAAAEKLQVAIKQVSARADTTAKDLGAAEFWVKGFKQIRLYLIDSALKQLEIETNESLAELGLNGWEVELDVERETKKGTISKGFTVFIKSPYNLEATPWESWGGGAGQRLRLAGTMALSNLILSQKGLKSNIFILDEPSAHLSTQGVEDLLENLHEHSRTKQIWLIEHHSFAYPFDGKVTVVKTEEGSRIED